MNNGSAPTEFMTNVIISSMAAFQSSFSILKKNSSTANQELGQDTTHQGVVIAFHLALSCKLWIKLTEHNWVVNLQQ